MPVVRRGLAVLIAVGGLALLVWYLGLQNYRSGTVANRRPDVAAVVLSGDAGFIGQSATLAEILNQFGIPTNGISTLRAFAGRQSIGQSAAIVDQAVQVAAQRFGAEKILLVGHSFGSDVIMATLPYLSPETSAKLIGVVLVVPTDPIYLKADPTELSYRGPPDATVGALNRFHDIPVNCIAGAEEEHSACPLLTGANITHVTLPGGHGLGHDIPLIRTALARAIAPMLDRSRTGRWSTR